MLSQTPCSGESPQTLVFDNWLTPNALFFVRNHHPVPRLEPASYTLRVEGLGAATAAVCVCVCVCAVVVARAAAVYMHVLAVQVCICVEVVARAFPHAPGKAVGGVYAHRIP